MEQLNDKNTDVLIVGAGPAGLMLACQLAMHHVSFRIIDQKEFPSSNSGALILQARSLEIFEQMGIAREAISGGIIAGKVNVMYNGKTTISTNIKDIGGNLSQFPFLLMLEQSKTERLLLNFITERGHPIERGIRFKSFIQNSDGVSSVVILPDGSESTIRSKYIIAADGANSTIRDYLNIPFSGKTYPNPIFILDCKAQTELAPNEISFVFSRTSVTGFLPLQGSRWRIDGNIPEGTLNLGNITFNHIAENFQTQTGLAFTFQDHEWFSVTHSHQKYAGSVHLQNCFLIGDAAHANSPVGAQGMNTGLQDAYNLAWKLAYVTNHKARPELLDSYSTERSGISKGFAQYADIVFRMVTSTNPFVKFFRLRVLKVIMKVLFHFMEKRSLRQQFFKSISQIAVHYRKNTLSIRSSDDDFLKGSPRPGDRLSYFEFFGESKTNTHKILDPIRFNLLVFAPDLSGEIKEIAESYQLAVTLITNLPDNREIYRKMGIKNFGYYLVRPDMHIAFCSSTLNVPHLKDYLQQFRIILY